MRRQGPRFSMVPPAAAFDARLEALDVRVLLVFGSHIDKQGWCFRSQVKMARELNVGRATLQRAITRLIGAGYLEQRPMPTADGSQGIHEYRVFFDPQDDEAGEDGAETDAPDGGADDEIAAAPPAHQRAGVPASGQGPAHAMERAANNDPFTTKLRERRGREDLEVPEPEGLAAFRRDWPATAVDDPQAVEAVWRALSAEDRRLAVSSIPAVLAARKAAGRTHAVGGATYLARKLWEPALIAASVGGRAASATGAAESEFAQIWTKAFWACALWSATNGVTASVMRHRRQAADNRVGWPMQGEAMRAGVAALAATLRQFPSDGAHAAAWARWLATRGFDVTDKFAGSQFWVFLPEHPPPGGAAHETADDLADAMGK